MKKKSFIVTEVLCVLLGWLGVHRYYTGYIGLGIAQTLTLGGCGIWALIDFIFISVGKYRDANDQELEDYNKNIGIGALILVLILGLFSTFGPQRTSNNTIINDNNVTNNGSIEKKISENDKLKIKEIQAEQKYNDVTNNKNIERKIKFDNAECTVDPNFYSCKGQLSENDKLEIKEIQAEQKYNNVTNNKNIERKIKFDNAECTVDPNFYSCRVQLSENDKLKIKEIQAELK